MKKPFAVLINNGFKFDFYCIVESVNAKQARSEFLRDHAGAWYAKPEMIRVRDESLSKTQKTLREKIADADARGGSWLALANEHAEAGRTAQAEKYYAKAQFWLDRVNKLLGNN